MVSRSRNNQRGAVSLGNASSSCWAVHADVGCAVQLTWTTRRRSCESTRTRTAAVETVAPAVATLFAPRPESAASEVALNARAPLGHGVPDPVVQLVRANFDREQLGRCCSHVTQSPASQRALSERTVL